MTSFDYATVIRQYKTVQKDYEHLATYLQTYFKAVCNYLKQTYQLEVDGSGKDVARACFLPYDPQVYINPKYLSHEKAV